LRPPPISTLFTYTTLFRSVGDRGAEAREACAIAANCREDREVRVLVQLLAVDRAGARRVLRRVVVAIVRAVGRDARRADTDDRADRKSTRLNCSHLVISYA